jgi:hypothetical protein
MENNIDIDKIINPLDTLSSSLLLLYFFNSQSSAYKLFPKDIVHLIDTNKFVNHIISFFTLLLVMSIILKENRKKMLLYSLIGYIWFLLTLKMAPIWLFILFFVLGISYFTNMFIKDREEQLMMTKDDIISQPEKDVILSKLKKIRTIFISLAILTTFIGYIFPQNNIKNGNMVGGNCGYDSNVFEYLFN